MLFIHIILPIVVVTLNVNKEVGMLHNESYLKIDRLLEAIYYDDRGRPVRDTIISEDEILNLKILLNTEHSFEELLGLL